MLKFSSLPNRLLAFAYYPTLLLVCLQTLPTFAQSFNWNGSHSTDWGNSANWTPGGIPDAGATVTIGTGPFPFSCTLDQNRTISSLTINGDSLSLNGHTLTTTGSLSLIAAFLENGTVNANRFNAIQSSHLKQLQMQKNGLGNDDLYGDNHFEDVIFIHNSPNTPGNSARLRFAQHQGDLFTGSNEIQKISSQLLQVAFNDTTNINGPLQINAFSAGGSFTFGQGGGHTRINSGSISTTGFTGTILTMNNVIQSGPGWPGTLAPSEFRLTDCQFGQRLHIDAGTNAIIENSQFQDSVHLSSPRIARLENNTFNAHLSVTKTGTSNDSWAGGNHFNSFHLIHSGTGNLSMGNSLGDHFHANSRFEKQNTGELRLANTDTSYFFANITLAASASGRFSFGLSGGVSLQTNGGGLYESGFTNANLEFRNFSQTASTANTTFNPNNVLFQNALIQQKLTFDCSNRIDIISSEFTDSIHFIGDNLADVRNSQFNQYVHFLKRSGGNNTWYGANQFNDGTFRNESSSGYLRLAGTIGDNFTGTTRFEKVGNSNLLPALNDTSHLQGILYLDNSTTGTLGLGNGNGTLHLAPGAVIRSNGFTAGTLYLNRVIQANTADFASFQPQTMEILNSELSQKFHFDVAGAATITQSEFNDSIYLSADNISNIINSKFDTQTTLIKRAGGNNNWTGGNEFNNATIRNESNGGYIRMAIANGDRFWGTTTFEKVGTSNIEAMRSDTSYVHGDIFLNNSTNGNISFGDNSGQTFMTGTASLRTAGFTAGLMRVRGVHQTSASTSQTFSPNQLDIRESNLTQPLTFLSLASYELLNSNFFDSLTIYAIGHNQVRENQFNGPTTFIKTSGSNNNWHGGNTFNRLTILNQSSTGFIRAGINLPDLFLDEVFLELQGTSDIQLGRTDTTIFHGNIHFTNTLTGAFEIGTTTSVVQMKSGAALKSNGLNSGQLRLRNFTQEGSTASDTLHATNFEFQDVTLGGELLLRSNNRIQLERCNLLNNVWLQAASFNVMRETVLGSPSNTVYIEKNGSEFNSWYGQNTFYNLHLLQNGTGHIRQANNRGDTLYGNTTLQRSNSGDIIWAHADTTFHHGSISFTGATLPSLATSGAGWIAITGSGNSNIQSTGTLQPRFNRLFIAKSDTLTLSTPIWVDNQFNLQSGIVRTTSTNFLGLPRGTNSTPGNDSGFVEGPIRFRVASNANSLSTINFASGNQGNWWPVQLSVSHTSNEAFFYEIETVMTDAAEISLKYPPGVTNISNVRLVRIRRFRESDMSISPNLGLRTTGTNVPSIRMYYSDLDSINEPNLITLLKTQPGNDTTWQDIGGSSGSDSHGNYIETSGFTSFSDFTFGNEGGNNPLPISLISFTAQRISRNSVSIEWKTETEIDNNYFTIERTQDGIAWTSIVQIDGAGNSNQTIEYQYTDTTTGPELCYFRLRQTDFDGTSTLSEVRAVNPWITKESYIISPQPASEQLIIRSSAPLNPANWQIYDSSGRSFILNYSIPNSAENAVQLNISQLKPGYYFINTGAEILKILVIN
jgi:hypothetical protein